MEIITQIIKFSEALKKNIEYFEDKVIIFPTDTVWGIGCSINSAIAVNKIYEIKKRDFSKPLAVLCSNTSELLSLTNESTSKKITKALTDKYMPGGLSIVLAKNKKVPDYVTSKLNNVGLRIPDYSPTLELIKKIGPLSTTSINESGHPPINDIEEITINYVGKVDIIILPDENFVPIETPSTVVLIENEEIVFLREGVISKEEIENFFKKVNK